MERRSGILIAVEGIDGAGKTTQVGLIEAFLLAAGETVVRSREPTNGPWGQAVRESASISRMDLADELHALTEDRREHVRDLIQPALDRGETVILDRYFYSTIAYQGVAGADPVAIASTMATFAPTPDLTLLIDVPADLGRARIQEGRQETPNHFEQMENLRRVRQAFLDLRVNHPTVAFVDGTGSIAEVRSKIIRLLIDGPLKIKHCAKGYGCDGAYCSFRMSGTCRWWELCKLASELPVATTSATTQFPTAFVSSAPQ